MWGHVYVSWGIRLVSFCNVVTVNKSHAKTRPNCVLVSLSLRALWVIQHVCSFLATSSFILTEIINHLKRVTTLHFLVKRSLKQLGTVFLQTLFLVDNALCIRAVCKWRKGVAYWWLFKGFGQQRSFMAHRKKLYRGFIG